MENINSLYDFITAAEKSRKYPPNTATSRRTALRIFEAELNEEEKNSLATFSEHFDQIYNIVYNKNKSKMSASSLETYKKRVRALINDFNKYGHDPAKMNSWVREIRSTRKDDKQIRLNKKEDTTEIMQTPEDSNTERQSVQMVRFELPLRPNAKAIILTPADITNEDVEKIRAYVDYLGKISQN